jgi:hypothetical protein
MLYNGAGLPVAAHFRDGWRGVLGANLGWVGVVDLALLSFCGKKWIGILTINDIKANGIKAKVPQPLKVAGPLTLMGKFPCCGGNKKPIRTSMLCKYWQIEVIRSLGSVRFELIRADHDLVCTAPPISNN